MKETKKKLPKYRQIEKDIVDHINADYYKQDDPLPTEAELMHKYDVSRVTVRQALSNLVEKGLVYKKQGSGSFISPKKKNTKSFKLKSFTEEMNEMDKSVSSIVISFNIVEAGHEISKLLGIAAHDRVYFIERVRMSDSEPMMFERTFMDVKMHNELNISNLEGSKFDYVTSKGFTIDYSLQEINAILCTGYISKLLEINANNPIIKVRNTTYIKEGGVLEYTELYLHPDKYQFSIIKNR